MKYSAHAEYINDNDIEVPSATTILKILNKPSLVRWANYLGFKRKDVKQVLEESSFLGTTMHQIIYAYLTKKYLILINGRQYYKDIISICMNNFLEWNKTHKIEPIFMEEKFVNDKFGGTTDFYGLVDNKKTILDFKTSKKPYASMFLQLAAYCMLLEEKNYEVAQVGIIIVNEKGYNEKFIQRKDLDKYIELFKILVEVFYKWYNINIDDNWGNIIDQ